LPFSLVAAGAPDDLSAQPRTDDSLLFYLFVFVCLLSHPPAMAAGVEMDAS
jgi:hypothetical protein